MPGDAAGPCVSQALPCRALLTVMGTRPVPGPAGTGPAADDLYLMAHHEPTGRLLLRPRAPGTGLAGHSRIPGAAAAQR